MPGDCHYLEGNANAKRRVIFTKGLLEQIGLEPERLRMINISSAMAQQFADYAEDMVATVQSLGPNPLKGEPRRPSPQTAAR